MNLLRQLWRSSLGKKYAMALTGVALFGFVVGHLLGNLQVFGAPDLINSYAHFLKSKPGLLWGARLGLLGCVALHIVAAVQLTLLNRSARPIGYTGGSAYGSTWKSRYMALSGSVILAFVIYHLLHFTAMQPGINGVGDFTKLKTTLAGEPVTDVYAMMILGFQVPWVSLFYLIAQSLLFLHLSHGLSSLFQSLGLRNHVWWPRITVASQILSLIIFIGYASIPVAVLAGLGREHAAKAKAALASQSTESLEKSIAGVAKEALK